MPDWFGPEAPAVLPEALERQLGAKLTSSIAGGARARVQLAYQEGRRARRALAEGACYAPREDGPRHYPPWYVVLRAADLEAPFVTRSAVRALPYLAGVGAVAASVRTESEGRAFAAGAGVTAPLRCAC